MRTGSPRRRQVIHGDKAVTQGLGWRRTGAPLIIAILVAVVSMAVVAPALAAEPPTCTKTEPGGGPATGGTTITITGTNFTGATSVNFDERELNAKSFIVNSEASITAVSPELPHFANAKAAITVTTPAGTSPVTASCKLRYEPMVQTVRPTSGPPGGGTNVTIEGRGFKASSIDSEAEHGFWVSGVSFGPNMVFQPGAREGLVNEVIEAPAPEGSGTVDVVVHTMGGASPITSADQFTYAPAATYHWYRNGAKLAEGTSVPIVVFGGKVNVEHINGLGQSNCSTVGGGRIENPVGGGAGVGNTNSLALYECKAPQCEEEVKAKTGLEGRGTITTENNPAATQEPAFPGWTNVLEESEVAGVLSVREKIGEPFVTFKTPSPPGMIRETVNCTIAANGMLVEQAVSEGELKPEIGAAKSGNLNGTKMGAPSTMKFGGPGTCPVCLHSQAAGEETWMGSLKYLGYNEQEVTIVKP